MDRAITLHVGDASSQHAAHMSLSEHSMIQSAGNSAPRAGRLALSAALPALVLSVLLLSALALPRPAAAQQCINKTPQPKCVKSAQQSFFIKNPKCSCCGDCELIDFVGVIVGASRFIFGITGSLALLMFMIGGFWWLTAAGSSDRIEKGKKTLVAAVVGIVIVFGAWLLVNSILAALTGNFKDAKQGSILTGEWYQVQPKPVQQPKPAK